MDCSTLKPGDICITRDGREVEYIGKSSAEYLTCPYVFMSACLVFTTHDSNGLSHINPDDDIIRKKPEKKVYEVWVNIYPGVNNSCEYITRVEADREAASTRIACIHIKQEYVEGEGL